ncbi:MULTISPECIES: PTS sugar transporter subunit IIA [Silvimonas]|uniref:PTS sugar transporter subunit IIA n=1 Tax=Silvimonas TaxID=300264 RepID=UPI0024B3B140|nr:MULTISPECIES: PTS sugar transporter subunit IIA [Silvimonas]MDR3428107.1 PTS sugar transporter subunit IIA [Silvimonas sp.]
MNISQLLQPQDIVLDLNVSSKTRLFEEIARRLEQTHGLAKDLVVKSLQDREKLGSTALGLGMALPHARLKGLTDAIAVFVRTELALPFDAPDGKPVSNILALIVPQHATQAHLEILAGIAQLFSDQDFRNKLRTCGTPEEVHQLFVTSATA